MRDGNSNSLLKLTYIMYMHTMYMGVWLTLVGVGGSLSACGFTFLVMSSTML